MTAGRRQAPALHPRPAHGQLSSPKGPYNHTDHPYPTSLTPVCAPGTGCKTPRSQTRRRLAEGDGVGPDPERGPTAGTGGAEQPASPAHAPQARPAERAGPRTRRQSGPSRGRVPERRRQARPTLAQPPSPSSGTRAAQGRGGHTERPGRPPARPCARSRHGPQRRARGALAGSAPPTPVAGTPKASPPSPGETLPTLRAAPLPATTPAQTRALGQPRSAARAPLGSASAHGGTRSESPGASHSPSEGARPRAAAASPASGRRSMRGYVTAPRQHASARRANVTARRRPRPPLRVASAPCDAARAEDVPAGPP